MLAGFLSSCPLVVLPSFPPALLYPLHPSITLAFILSVSKSSLLFFTSSLSLSLCVTGVFPCVPTFVYFMCCVRGGGGGGEKRGHRIPNKSNQPNQTEPSQPGRTFYSQDKREASTIGTYITTTTSTFFKELHECMLCNDCLISLTVLDYYFACLFDCSVTCPARATPFAGASLLSCWSFSTLPGASPSSHCTLVYFILTVGGGGGGGGGGVYWVGDCHCTSLLYGTVVYCTVLVSCCRYAAVS